jgi:glycogen(starch) synthase
MTVALFASAFHPHLGGVEEAVRQIAHAYRRAGIPAIVLTNRWPRDLPMYEEFEGIPIHRLAFRVPDGSLKAHVNYRLTGGMIRRQMLGILRSNGVKLLHVHCVSCNGFYALKAKRALGLPLVVTAHGELTMDPDAMFERSAFARDVLHQCLGGADAVTACSAKTLEDVAKFHEKPLGEKAQVVYNGIDLADFARSDAYRHITAEGGVTPYLLAIGRLVRHKGFDVLLRAMASANVRSHELLIAGDGPELEPLKQLVLELNIAHRVKFLGRAKRLDAVRLFKGCDALMLPSRADEGLPLVSLEAMAAGKPVVATRSGGIPEFITDGENGLLVPKEDVPALATAITRITTDARLRAALGTAGRRRVEAFTWDAVARQYLDIYGGISGIGASPSVAEAEAVVIGR